MQKFNSADLTIREAVKFSNENIENCVFTEKEIAQIFRATFSAQRSDSERKKELIRGILGIIETASGRATDSSSEQ